MDGRTDGWTDETEETEETDRQKNRPIDRQIRLKVSRQVDRQKTSGINLHAPTEMLIDTGYGTKN